MKKLIMCQGLPGSGKSYWAESFAAENRANGKNVYIVNKDDIRIELGKAGWTWSQKNEKDVIRRRDELILNALALHEEVTIISSDTNLGKKHETRLKELAKNYGAEFEIKSFLDVPIETCIQRDSGREGKARVGEEVIRKMASQNNLVTTPVIEPYEPNPSLPIALICDLDGTLALNDGHRGHYDYDKVGDDKCNKMIRHLLWVYASKSNYKILYMSGREDRCRELTINWLRKHYCPEPENYIFMRKTGDHRKDFIVKYELFNAHVRNSYNVRFVLDDRNQVVDMWRKLGLTCLQVADGDF